MIFGINEVLSGPGLPAAVLSGVDEFIARETG